MPLIRSLFLLLLCLPPFLLAAEPPTREAVDASLATLPDRKLPENQQLQVQQLLEQTLAQLNRRDEVNARLAAPEDELADAPERISPARPARQAQRAPAPDQPTRVQPVPHLLE